MVDRIAYVGSDDNLYTINKDGSDSRRLTGERRLGTGGVIHARELQNQVFYTWPTWSPDGTKIAASQVITEEDSVVVSLQTIDVDTAELTRIYDNEPDASPIIAQGVPHYIYWSPDGSRLSFIASTPEGLTLFASGPQEKDPPFPVATNGPIYFRWSNNGRSLLLHSGQELMVAQVESSLVPRGLNLEGDGFRAPAWLSDGDRIVYVSQASGTNNLYVADIQSEDSSKAIAQVDNYVAFLRSPVGDEVAVAEGQGGSDFLYNRLTIVDVETASKRVLVEERYLAFFWAPDGEKIAYASVDSRSQGFTWKVVPARGGPPKTLAQFAPSQELFTLLLFFDQYAYSNSVWSPDSTQLVFTGALTRELTRRNGGSPEEDKVFVLNVDDDSPPLEIASGSLAFWSWN